MRRLFQFGFYLLDTFTHTHSQVQGKWDKILIRNTTQRHLDNQEDNDVNVNEEL